MTMRPGDALSTTTMHPTVALAMPGYPSPHSADHADVPGVGMDNDPDL